MPYYFLQIQACCLHHRKAAKNSYPRNGEGVLYAIGLVHVSPLSMNTSRWIHPEKSETRSKK